MDGGAPLHAAAPGRIGPNAVIQLGHALIAIAGERRASEVFREAGHLPLLAAPPEEMVDERLPAALFAALWRALPDEIAARVADDAGRRTADYVMGNRIPRPAQLVLCHLPGRLGARMLLDAVRRNAWTFAGSGVCAVPVPGRVIEISGNPLVMPGCVWHRAVFTRLFRAMVSPHARVRHAACCGEGAPACRFEISL
jgi:divinyl protochlorophyllide a 8-vinyl-reductase